MKTEKTITQSLNELYLVAESFVKILELNRIKSHFTISDNLKGNPVASDLKIVFYQPDENTYCLKTKYTHINIGGVEFGKYGDVSYKFDLTPKDIDLITKQAKEVYNLFKVFSFGSFYEKSLLDIKNSIKRHNLNLKKAKKEYAEMEKVVESYR